MAKISIGHLVTGLEEIEQKNVRITILYDWGETWYQQKGFEVKSTIMVTIGSNLDQK